MRFLRRWRRRRSDAEIGPVPDDLPKSELFEEPLDVSVSTPDPEALDDDRRKVVFRVEIRDAAGRRCPDLSVTAAITGPERSASGEAHTDLLGRVRFQMEGPPGDYRFEIADVAGGALEVAPGAFDVISVSFDGPGRR